MSAMQPPLYQPYESTNSTPVTVPSRTRADTPPLQPLQVTRPRTLNDYRIGVQSTSSRPSSPLGTGLIMAVAAVEAGTFVLLDPLHVMPGATKALHAPASTTSPSVITPTPVPVPAKEDTAAMSSPAIASTAVSTPPMSWSML